MNLELFTYPVGSKSNVGTVARFDHVKYLRDSQIEILNAQNEKGLENKLSTGGRNPEVLRIIAKVQQLSLMQVQTRSSN